MRRRSSSVSPISRSRIAVAIRFGAIPFHLWAARLTDAVPGDGPADRHRPGRRRRSRSSGSAWADASIAPLLVDLGAERGVVLAIAVASIVLAALAALVQDDIEHIVGYSIVGDAGVALLALVALDPDGLGAGPDLDPRARRRPERVRGVGRRSARCSSGPAGSSSCAAGSRRSPILAVAFGLVVVASIGFPGLAAFEARSALVVSRSMVRWPRSSLLGTLAPLAYYGRLLSIGLGRPDGPPDPEVDWRPRATRLDLTALGGWWRTTWDANRAFTAALVAVLLGLALGHVGGAFGGPRPRRVSPRAARCRPRRAPRRAARVTRTGTSVDRRSRRRRRARSAAVWARGRRGRQSAPAQSSGRAPSGRRRARSRAARPG